MCRLDAVFCLSFFLFSFFSFFFTNVFYIFLSVAVLNIFISLSLFFLIVSLFWVPCNNYFLCYFSFYSSIYYFWAAFISSLFHARLPRYQSSCSSAVAPRSLSLSCLNDLEAFDSFLARLHSNRRRKSKTRKTRG